MSDRPRPSGWFYPLALVPLAIGAVVAVTLFRGTMSDIENMQRVVVPGQGDISLEPGSYIVFGELTSTVAGVSYHATSMSLRCGLANASGAGVPLATAGASTTYTLGGYSGQSMFEFSIDQAGTYRLTCEGEGGRSVVAIGHGIGVDILLSVVSSLAGLGAAIVVALLVGLKRRRAATVA